MKIIGLICLILGIMAAVKAFNDEPPKQASEAYQRGYNAGRVTVPVVLLGLGLWLLLRDGSRRVRPTPSRPRSVSGPPPRPTPPPVVLTQIPVKIHCGCGQNYAFEAEPVGGRMPAPVTCPVCGADGTETANAFIAGALAARAETSAWTQANASGRGRRLHPALLAGMAVIGLIVVAVAIRVVVRISSIRNPARQDRPRTTESSWTRRDASPPQIGRPNSPATQPPGAASEGNRGRTSRPGSARDAAPVPPDVTAVEVFWGNRWWPATILRRDPQRAYIHYDGWNSSYDEWVTPDRLRPRR
jgi:hypothetical protein